MATDNNQSTILATIVAPMVKEAGQASAQATDAVTVQTAANGTQYALFRFREGMASALPKGVIDCRPQRTKAVFADQVPMPLDQLKAGDVLAFSPDTWDYAPDDDEGDFEESASDEELDAPF